MFAQIELEGNLLVPHSFGGEARYTVVSLAILQKNKEFAQMLTEMDFGPA